MQSTNQRIKEITEENKHLKLSMDLIDSRNRLWDRVPEICMVITTIILVASHAVFTYSLITKSS